MQVNKKLFGYLDTLNLNSAFELVNRFINDTEEFCNRSDVTSDVKQKIKLKLQPIYDTYDELNRLAVLPSSEENLEKIKILVRSLNLADVWYVSEITEQEKERVSNNRKVKENKLIDFIKKRVIDVQHLSENIIDALKKENEKQGEDIHNLLDELDDLAEQRKEIERVPVTQALSKRENLFRRFIRIMTEKSELWSEVETEDKIVLRNSDGEIRGYIAKESEESKEAIVRTEKSIIRAKKHYSIFQKLRNLTKSEIFTMEPSQREQKLNMNYLNMEICKGKIEDSTMSISKNSERIQKINSAYERFVENIESILSDNGTDKESSDKLEIAAKLIAEIDNIENIIKKDDRFDDKENEFNSLIKIVNESRAIRVSEKGRNINSEIDR